MNPIKTSKSHTSNKMLNIINIVTIYNLQHFIIWAKTHLVVGKFLATLAKYVYESYQHYCAEQNVCPLGKQIFNKLFLNYEHLIRDICPTVIIHENAVVLTSTGIFFTGVSVL